MILRKVWRVGFLGCFVFLTAATMHTAPSPLKIELKPMDVTVENGQTFSVDTTVRNVSKVDRPLWIWSCSYADHWRADDPAVQVEAQSCNANFLTKLMLKPGEAYSKAVFLRVSVPAEKLMVREVGVRLGFMDWTNQKGSGDRPLPLLWSQPIKVHLKDSGPIRP